jgi:RHS repeat-associated protein
VSNRSDQHVYFDNLKVGITAGNIIEENHYYAYGLKIAAISSKKLGDISEGKLKNPYQYNGKEMLDEDADLNWYDYGFRNYDPQIGRFMQLDPLTDDYPELTPFQYASCDPITNIDIDGLEGGGAVGGAVSAGRDFSYASSAVSSAMSYVTPIFHVVRAGSKAAKATSLIGTIGKISSIVIQTAITAGNLINNKIYTGQVGKLIAYSQKNGLIKRDGSPSDDGVYGTDRNLKGWEKETEVDLRKKMIDLINDGTSASAIMRKVAMKMTDQFLSNKGGEFSDPDLNNAVSNDDNFKAFEINVLLRFQAALKTVGGDLNRLAPFTLGNPAFNRSVNNKDGLGITIHGVSYVEVHLIKFEINPKSGNYYVGLKIDLYDNFGLGSEDIKIDNVWKQWYKWIGGVGLKAWYLLQHRFNHAPLRTHIQINVGSHMNLNSTYRPG